MVVSYVGGGTAVEHATGAEQRYYDFTLPAGTVAGDVFIFNLTTSSTVTTEVTLPVGTEIIAPMSSKGVGVSGGVYWWKVPSTPPVSIRFDWVTPRRGSLVYVQARGDNLNLHAVDVNAWAAAVSTSHPLPSVDVGNAVALLVAGLMVGSGSETITAPGAWVARTDPTQREGRMATQMFTGPGASPSGAWTTGGSYESLAWTIAIIDGTAGPSPVVSGASTSALTTPTNRWIKMTSRISGAMSSRWWAVLPTTAGHRIWNLSTMAQGPIVDTRMSARAAMVCANDWLGVLRTHPTASRFSSYNQGLAALVTDAVVPLTAENTDQSPITLHRSPNGYLWAANVAGGNVLVSRSTNNGATWSAATIVVAGFTLPTGLVAFANSGTTVVLVAVGNDSGGRAVRSISQASSSIAASSWTVETLPSMPAGTTSDDHLSVTSAADGRVLVVSKTTNDANNLLLIYVLARSTSGVWTQHTVETGPDNDDLVDGFSRPDITVIGSNAVVTYGSINAPQHLSTRTAALSNLDVWTSRTSIFTGPNYSDGGHLPPAGDVALMGGQYPIVAHNRATGGLMVSWQDSGASAGAQVLRCTLGDPRPDGYDVMVRSLGATSVRVKVGTNEALTAGVVFGSSFVPDADGYGQSIVTTLAPHAKFHYGVELTAGSTVTTVYMGTFTTLPVPGSIASHKVVVGSCYQSLGSVGSIPLDGAFPRMLAHDPLLNFQLGDQNYADNTGTSQASHRADMERSISDSPSLQRLQEVSGTVYVKSDHDPGGGNNAFPGAWTVPNRAATLQMYPYPPRPDENALYCAIVVGRVRYIFTDTRYLAVSGSTRMGATQKAWFKAQLQMPEPVKIWVQESAWIDNRPAETGGDKWRDFPAEMTEISNMIRDFLVGTLATVHGDQHALAADNGSHNSKGGFPSFCAAPFRQSSSLKTVSPSDWSEGMWPVNPALGESVAQYGVIEVADSEDYLTVTFKGYDSNDVVRVSMSLVVNVTPEGLPLAFGGTATEMAYGGTIIQGMALGGQELTTV